MDAERLLQQADGLIAKGGEIPLRPPGEQWASGPTDRVEPGPFADWRSQGLAFLRSVLPSEHTYVAEFSAVTTPQDPYDPRGSTRNAGVGVLTAFREDLAAGYLTEVRKLISAEVFTDFLDMAQHLLDEGYYHAAASVTGAVLEDALRRTLRDQDVKATGNLESMNQVALDQGLYRPLVFTQVKVWIGLRNDADHGNWAAVEADRVQSMIRDLPSFLARDLQLA